jgi:DNA-binding NarL/FixJ family response regulator
MVNERQFRIVQLIACGADAEQIEEELGLSRWVLRDQIRRLRERFDCSTMVELPDALRAAGVDLEECEPVA